MIVESLVAALLLAGGGYGAYRASGVRRARDAARRKRAEVDSGIVRTEEVLASRRRAVDEAAKRRGQTRSGFLAEAARKALG